MPLLQQLALRATFALGAIAFFTTANSTPMFNESSFAQIKFLEGRWKGLGPDGKEFFEEYVLAGPGEFRSLRHADSTFSKSIDGSTVVLKDGEVVSTWGDFTWRAVSLSSTKACFEPINAPSSFCWEQLSENEVSVTQRWKDAEGKDQSFVLKLNRIVQ